MDVCVYVCLFSSPLILSFFFYDPKLIKHIYNLIYVINLYILYSVYSLFFITNIIIILLCIFLFCLWSCYSFLKIYHYTAAVAGDGSVKLN